MMGREHTVIHTTDKETRYLGVWFSTKRSHLRLKASLSAIVSDFLSLLNNKPIGPSHVTYLINRVLIPRLIYVAQVATLSENESSIFKPVIIFAKRALGLPKCFSSAALQHEGQNYFLYFRYRCVRS
jgi:hypothetical protein